MKTFFKFLIIFLIFSLGSCSDPIFFTVFKETPKLKPLIGGSPTNFVTLNNKLYVASGKQIWEYDGNSWNKWNKLGDRVVRLAVASSSLYALYLPNDNGQDGKIKNCTYDSDLGRSRVQSIYAANNILFSCEGTEGAYTIYSNSDWNSPITTSENVLKGVVYDASSSGYYYLCTSKGIICVDGSFNYKETFEKDTEFTGIINLDTTNNKKAAAITTNGAIYEIVDATATNKNISTGSAFDNNRYTTGALAIWKQSSDPTLLLVGRRESYYSLSTGYTYGYVEITLDASGNITGSGYNNPGEGSPSTVDSNERYVSSIGKEPVNYIIQAPSTVDSKMTLFASTQTNGVWSYRIRDENWQWNAEQ